MTDAMVNERVVTAFFDDRESAERAIRKITDFGMPRERVRLIAGGDGDHQADESGGGFWEALKDLFMPDEDRHAYAEGLRRGGYLVSVRVDEHNYEQVLDFLDDEGTIDMDERESSWRSEGWRVEGRNEGQSETELASGSDYGAADSESTQQAEGVIPIAEEQLKIGKRDVSHGRVRIRSYVVEEPVRENVSLREENVQVERRPVDRALTGDEELFQDRTIEVEERAEEPVIAKETRVTEELVVRKDVDERTEEVTDTVRHTEVDVEDERSQPQGVRSRRRAGR